MPNGLIKSIVQQIISQSFDDNNDSLNVTGTFTYQAKSTQAKSIVLNLHSLYFNKDKETKFKADGHFDYANNGRHDNTFAFNRTESILFAGLYDQIIISPDYIGVGADAGIHTHPYLIKESLAKTAYNMLEATKKYADQNGIALDGKVYIVGLGEGANAALATVELLKQFPISGLSLQGVAAVEGLYNLPNAFSYVNSNDPAAQDLLNSYNRYYSLNASSLSDSNIQAKLAQNSVNTVSGNHTTLYLSCIDNGDAKDKDHVEFSSSPNLFDYNGALTTDCSYAAYYEIAKSWFP